MCWTCACGELENGHGEGIDGAPITTESLERAAEHAGVSIPQAVANIVLSLAHFDPELAKQVGAIETPYAACRVLKSSDERRYTLGLAYPALQVDVAVAKDGFRDFVGMEALEDAAWRFMLKGASVGLHHQDGTEGAGTVVESYIYRAEPWHCKASDGSEQVIMPGDWLVGVVWKPETWPLVKAGVLRGYSPQGGAQRDLRPTPERLAQLRRA